MRSNDSSEIAAASVAAAEPTRRAGERSGVTAAADASRPVATDRVSTAGAAELEAAVAKAKSEASGARAAQLAEIEAAVRKGTYRPDPARIAQKIIEDAELIARLHAMLKR